MEILLATMIIRWCYSILCQVTANLATYIFYFVHMCMALLLWLCQISSIIVYIGAVLLCWTVIQSPPIYVAFEFHLHTYVCCYIQILSAKFLLICIAAYITSLLQIHAVLNSIIWPPILSNFSLTYVYCCSLQHAVTCYCLDLVYLVQQGQRTTQDLTYVTVDHSQRRPINVPNENLDVQYTGVKFDAKAPAV